MAVPSGIRLDFLREASSHYLRGNSGVRFLASRRTALVE
jgi:hypothetical protein